MAHERNPRSHVLVPGLGVLLPGPGAGQITPAEEQLCQLRGAKMTFFTTGQGAGLFGFVQVCLWKERKNFITLDHMKGA